MSLDSCASCGHALGIADHRCRQCSPTTKAAAKAVHGAGLYLLVALAGLAFALLIYRAFLI